MSEYSDYSRLKKTAAALHDKLVQAEASNRELRAALLFANSSLLVALRTLGYHIDSIPVIDRALQTKGAAGDAK